MPKAINRPRDTADAQQMQQGSIDLDEDAIGEQMDEADPSGDAAEEQSPA